MINEYIYKHINKQMKRFIDKKQQEKIIEVNTTYIIIIIHKSLHQLALLLG